MDYSDEEVYSLFLEHNEDAKDIIYNKYKYIVDVLLHEYHNVAFKLGIDLKEFEQEAYYAFSDALINFRDDKNVKLETFISLCIRRRLQKIIKSYGGEKAKFLNSSYSLDYDYDEEGTTLRDLIQDVDDLEPLNKLTNKESYEELLEKIKESLSCNEYEIFNYLKNGYDSKKIASLTNKTLKQVDNTVQRIKQKIRNITLE